MQTRYYDPEVGRFISQDSVEYADPEAINGLNLYAYCGNNPVMNVDPTGEAFLTFLIISIVLGAVIGGAVNGYKAYNEGADALGVVGAILGGAILGGAMGAVMAIGGAAGFASLGLATTVVGGSTMAALGISLGIGVGAGFASYTVETLMRRDKHWDWGEFSLSGVSGGYQAIATFGVGYICGRAGLYNSSLTKMSEEAFMQYLVNTTGVSFTQSLVYTSNMLISNFLSRIVLGTFPAAVFRTIFGYKFKR